MIRTYQAAPDIDVIASTFTIPGFGFLPINAFVLHGPEPILVETGAVVERDEFMAVLRLVIDPAELKWIWLTHTDPDHIGALPVLLAENPSLRLITTFLGVGIMGLSGPPPMDRVRFVNPGETITLGDRRLHALKPPAFDNPITTGFFEEKSRALFSADCFGALLQGAPDSAAEVDEDGLLEGMVAWAKMDASWLHKVDRSLFAKDLQRFGSVEPKLVLCDHLPAAPGNMMPRLLDNLATVPDSPPFVGPNQAALEQMLAAGPPAGDAG